MADETSEARIKVVVDGEEQLNKLNASYAALNREVAKFKAATAGSMGSLAARMPAFQMPRLPAGTAERLGEQFGRNVLAPAFKAPFQVLGTTAKVAGASLLDFGGALALMTVRFPPAALAITAFGAAASGLVLPLFQLVAGVKMLGLSFKWATDAADEALRVRAAARRYYPGASGLRLKQAEDAIDTSMQTLSSFIGESALGVQDRVNKRLRDVRLGKGAAGDRDLFARWGITPENRRAFEQAQGKKLDLTDWVRQFVLQRERLQAQFDQAPDGSAAKARAARGLSQMPEDTGLIFGAKIADLIQTLGSGDLAKLQKNIEASQKLAEAQGDTAQNAIELKIATTTAGAAFENLKKGIGRDATPAITEFMDTVRDRLVGGLGDSLRKLGSAISIQSWRTLTELFKQLEPTITSMTTSIAASNPADTAKSIVQFGVELKNLGGVVWDVIKGINALTKIMYDWWGIVQIVANPSSAPKVLADIARRKLGLGGATPSPGIASPAAPAAPGYSGTLPVPSGPGYPGAPGMPPAALTPSFRGTGGFSGAPSGYSAPPSSGAGPAPGAPTGGLGGAVGAEAPVVRGGRNTGLRASPPPSASPINYTEPQVAPTSGPFQRVSIGGREAASIRYNNPGAQYPSREAQGFGQTGYGIIGGGHKIAAFPTPEAGAASNFDLFSRRYTGMQVGAAGTKWTGANGFGVPGYDPNMVITKDMIRDPKFAIPFMKAIARREAGKESPLTDEQWQRAHQTYLQGGVGGVSPSRAASAGVGQPIMVPPGGMGGRTTGALALDDALQLKGKNEGYDNADIKEYLRTGGVNMDPAKQAWCAATINAGLARTGGKGTGSQVATSYLNWGSPVKGAPQYGDVMVVDRGRRAGQTGGHVGFATGETREVNGRTQYQMYSGNTGNKAGLGWYSPNQVKIRRGPLAEGEDRPDLGSATKTADLSNAAVPYADLSKQIGAGAGSSIDGRKLGQEFGAAAAQRFRDDVDGVKVPLAADTSRGVPPRSAPKATGGDTATES